MIIFMTTKDENNDDNCNDANSNNRNKGSSNKNKRSRKEHHTQAADQQTRHTADWTNVVMPIRLGAVSALCWQSYHKHLLPVCCTVSATAQGENVTIPWWTTRPFFHVYCPTHAIMQDEILQFAACKDGYLYGHLKRMQCEHSLDENLPSSYSMYTI